MTLLRSDEETIEKYAFFSIIFVLIIFVIFKFGSSQGDSRAAKNQSEMEKERKCTNEMKYNLEEARNNADQARGSDYETMSNALDEIALRAIVPSECF